jgi:putative transposase
VAIVRPNQVWSADITYIRPAHGFVYLVAIIDWYSRTVLSWVLSTTLEKEFCLEALCAALLTAKPEIFNTDQGAQFTSPEFTGLLESHGIQTSMDGRGRVYDNIFVERLWRTVKYEEVYLHEYRSAGASGCVFSFIQRGKATLNAGLSDAGRSLRCTGDIVKCCVWAGVEHIPLVSV